MVSRLQIMELFSAQPQHIKTKLKVDNVIQELKKIITIPDDELKKTEIKLTRLKEEFRRLKKNSSPDELTDWGSVIAIDSQVEPVTANATDARTAMYLTKATQAQCTWEPTLELPALGRCHSYAM